MGSSRSINLWHAKRRGNWLIGCGIVLAILVLILVGLGIFVAVNARGWTASGIQQGLTAAIEQAPIDDAEKQESIAVIEDFVQRFRDKDVSFQELGGIFEALEDSPLVPAAMAMGTGQSYFKDSGLTDEQKADGMTQLQRITYGLVEKDINESDLVEVLQPLKAKATETEVVTLNFDGASIRIKMPRDTTDDEVLAFIEAARTKADEKELDPAPPPFDLSNELQRLIDAGIGDNSETDDTDSDEAEPVEDTEDEGP